MVQEAGHSRQVEPPGRRKKKRPPAVSAVTAGILAIIGTGVGATFQGWWGHVLEQDKLESELILRATSPTDDSAKRANLSFLIDAGLIPNHRNAVRTILNDATRVLPTFLSPSDVPVEGVGGDAEFNRQKNRTSEPLQVEDVKLDGLIHLPIGGPVPWNRSAWTEPIRKQVQEIETRAVRVEAYLAGARLGSPESSSGRVSKSEFESIHLSLVADPGLVESHAVIAVLSARIRADHPTWSLDTLRKFVADGTQVRVTGWLLYNQQHFNQVGKWRATIIEISPVLDLEYRKRSSWRQLCQRLPPSGQPLCAVALTPSSTRHLHRVRLPSWEGSHGERGTGFGWSPVVHRRVQACADRSAAEGRGHRLGAES
jgi:hypothetical protein